MLYQEEAHRFCLVGILRAVHCTCKRKTSGNTFDEVTIVASLEEYAASVDGEPNQAT